MKSSVLILILVCWIFSSCTKDEVPATPQYQPSQPVVGKTYSASEITAFKEITLNASNGLIVKLPKQASVYLVDTIYPYLTNEIDSIISEINILLAGNLVLTRTTNKAGSLLQIYLTDRNTYINAEPQAATFLQNSDKTGLGYINWDSKHEIYHGSVFIDMSRTGKDTLQQRYLIHHETMHALGFLGHVSLVEFSYSVLFNYAVTPYALDYSFFDKKMLRLLYNTAIKPGMNETDLNAAVVNL